MSPVSPHLVEQHLGRAWGGEHDEGVHVYVLPQVEQETPRPVHRRGQPVQEVEDRHVPAVLPRDDGPV